MKNKNFNIIAKIVFGFVLKFYLPWLTKQTNLKMHNLLWNEPSGNRVLKLKMPIWTKTKNLKITPDYQWTWTMFDSL